MSRIRFTPFWKVVHWGFINGAFRLWKGGDKYHNLSHFIYVPLVGELVVFDKGYDPSGPEHLYAWSKEDGWEGHYEPGCKICEDLLIEVEGGGL